MHAFIRFWAAWFIWPLRAIFGRSDSKDLLIILVLAAIGLVMMLAHPWMFAVLVGGAILNTIPVVFSHREKQTEWQLLRTSYMMPLPLPPTSRSLATQAQVGFVAVYQKPLVIPEAGILLDADSEAIRIVSYDDKYDVILPIEMIAQIEFDPGNFPNGLQAGRAKARRLCLRRYMPTIFLGVRCGVDQELVVYPLCFHPDMATDAHNLYEQLRVKYADVPDKITCPLSATEFEQALPGSFDGQSLPRSVALRFWPDHKGGHIVEWLSR